MKILRVDMKNTNVVFQDLPKDWQFIGGSGLSSRSFQKNVSITILN